ncbi:MAG: ComF family protein [Solibacillus sp.]
MHKPIVDCLLCNTPLQQIFGWQNFFIRQLPQVICARCEGKFERIIEQQEEGVRSLFMYNAAMKDYIHRYKFLGDVALAKVFSRLLSEIFKQQQALIVPIPMHPANLKKRTFAPVDELLTAAEIPFTHVLAKTTMETQVGKTRAQRLAVSQLFDVVDRKLIENNEIILFDDLYTTGTTIDHAKRALYEAGAREVQVVTLIHG